MGQWQSPWFGVLASPCITTAMWNLLSSTWGSKSRSGNLDEKNLEKSALIGWPKDPDFSRLPKKYLLGDLDQLRVGMDMLTVAE